MKLITESIFDVHWIKKSLKVSLNIEKQTVMISEGWIGELRLLYMHQRQRVIWKGHKSPHWTFHTTSIIIYLRALVSPSQRCCQPVSQALSEDVSLDRWHIWATFSPALPSGSLSKMRFTHHHFFPALLLHVLPTIPTTNFTRKWNVKPSAEGDFHLGNEQTV